MSESPSPTPPQSPQPRSASSRPARSRRRSVRTALRRSWRLVRGERRGPVSRLLSRPVTLRVGSRRRQLTVGTLSVIVIVLVLVVGSGVVFATPLLGARSVQVVGAEKLTTDKVRRAADIEAGTPLARLDTGKIESRVHALPEVAKVAVVRAWPATVRIKLTERRPAAVAQRSDQFVVIDTLGVPYRVTKQRPAKLPLIKVDDADVLAIPDFAIDPKPLRNKTLIASVRVVKALTPALSEKLLHITAPDPHRISLQLDGGRSVFWGAAGDPTENVRKAAAATALLSRSGRTLDVSTPGVVSIR